MEVKKEAAAVAVGVPTAAQLEKINALAKGTLTAEQVYVFSVRLCDDQVDRDFERFDAAALPALAKLFVGKSGIVDHKWSAGGQLARIFDTEIVTENGVTAIKAWAYIRRGGAGDEWIADIEAGIKKEVSVGCAMGQSVCAVCGGEYGSCGHRDMALSVTFSFLPSSPCVKPSSLRRLCMNAPNRCTSIIMHLFRCFSE